MCLLYHPICVNPRPSAACAGTKEAFEIGTVLDDFSAGGLSLRLPWRVAVGAKLFAVVRLTTDPLSWAPALGVAVHGVVRRVESQPDGTYSVEVACTRHRFLWGDGLNAGRVVLLPPGVS
jgi:hypothetical protein